MTILPDWRSETDTANFNKLERPGFAWEFLRRNQEYRAGYERIMSRGNQENPEVATAAANFAQNWGLICTGRPKSAGPPGDAALASGNLANRRHSHTGPGRLR